MRPRHYLTPLFPTAHCIPDSDRYENSFSLTPIGAITRLRYEVGGMNVGRSFSGYMLTSELRKTLARALGSLEHGSRTLRLQFETCYAHRPIGVPVNDEACVTGALEINPDICRQLVLRLDPENCLRIVYQGQLGPHVGIDDVDVKRVCFAGEPRPFKGWASKKEVYRSGYVKLRTSDLGHTIFACGNVLLSERIMVHGKKSPKAYEQRPVPWSRQIVVPNTRHRLSALFSKAGRSLAPNLRQGLYDFAKGIGVSMEELTRIFRAFEAPEYHTSFEQIDGPPFNMTIARPEPDSQTLTMIDDDGRHAVPMLESFPTLDAAVELGYPLQLPWGKILTPDSTRALHALLWG